MKFNWKQLFEFEHRDVFALDIGSSAVKIIEMRKDDDAGYAVTAAGMADIPASNNNNEQANIAEIIRTCLRSTRIKTRMAVCSVSGPEVAVRYFSFPSLSPEEIEGAVMLEASQVCPFNIDLGSVDYRLIPDGENTVQGVLVAATNRLIERKTQAAKDASLNCVLMDVDGLALLNCFCKYEMSHTNQTTAILNVGNSYTNLAIMADNALPFIRDITYAGNKIAARIAGDNDLTTETVKKILSGQEDSSLRQSEFDNSLERACEKLIIDVSETLRYFSAEEKTAAVERILICGGFALVRGFVELLNRRLPAEVVLWNPFERIRCKADRLSESMLKRNGPAMAIAAGLAMRSI